MKSYRPCPPVAPSIPCPKCQESGMDGEKWCSACNGTGRLFEVDLPEHELDQAISVAGDVLRRLDERLQRSVRL